MLTCRALDTQGLADRLAGLGWTVDRTALARIERGDRKVTVDELGRLAVALNVPLTVLLLPVFEGADVELTSKGGTAAVNRWLLFESMLGNEAYPDLDLTDFALAVAPLDAYNTVRNAQHEANRKRNVGEDSDEWLAALQELVEHVDWMERIGCPAQDLIEPETREAIDRHGIKPTPNRRFKVGQIGATWELLEDDVK